MENNLRLNQHTLTQLNIQLGFDVQDLVRRKYNSSCEPKMRHPLNQSLSHITALDFVRLVAVLLVFALHFIGFAPGWVGVDIFFVLSGFLITRILLQTKEISNALSTFYMRRLIRIFPAYYLLLIMYFTFFQWINPTGSRAPWLYLFYLGDFNGFFPDLRVMPLHHTWSLAVEEQFYLVWPIVIFFLKPQSALLLALISWIVVGLIRTILIAKGVTVYIVAFSIFTRTDGLFAGSILAIILQLGLVPTKRSRWLCLGASLILFGIVAFGTLQGLVGWSRQSLLFSALYFPLAVIAISLGMWFLLDVESTSLLGKFLTFRPFVYLGRISYGLYLYHFPISYMIQSYFGDPVTLADKLLPALLGLSLTLIAAVLSWHFFENPLNELKSYWSYNRNLAKQAN